MSKHYREYPSTTIMMCCQEIQFEYSCRYCDEPMGCYFCDFNLDQKHDCMQD